MPEDNKNKNSYNYNPNRPQEGNNLNNNTSNSSTQKLADTAVKGAAQYIAPGVGANVYDTLKKTPIAGNVIDNTTQKISENIEKVPGVKKSAEVLDNSGITDKVNSGLSVIPSETASNKSLKGNTFNKMSQDNSQDENLTYSDNFRKNNFFNNIVRNGVLEEEESFSDNNISDLDDVNDLGNSQDSLDSGVEQNTSLNENFFDNDNKNNVATDILSGLAKNWFQKHKLPIIGIGIGILFFFLIIFLILGGGAADFNSLGYYDSECNYNDTKVSLVSCSSESEILETYELQDYVIRATYVYTKDADYSDETIKALMIILKTNVLSYGNYNSSNKDVEVQICDVLSGFSNSQESDLSMFDGVDDKVSELNKLYDSISEYLLVSSSYKSTISSLGMQNIVSFDKNTLKDFENLANSGSDYSEILSSVYDSEDNDDSKIYRNTLYIGDSRIKEMLEVSVINNSNTVYGEGYGYNWLVGNGIYDSSNTNAVNGAIDGLNLKMKDKTNYNIVIWLGNDDVNIDYASYYQKYYELATNEWSKHNIYIVSLGPVNDGNSSYLSNDKIDNFNQNMKSYVNSSNLSNLFFIDLNYNQDTIDNYDEDGIHYSDSDNRKIYQAISQEVTSEISSNLELYRLSDYCVYYDVITDNVAYWWPIGSSTATSGNIYGGTPVSVRITSYFGGRYDPITGKWVGAHGAIDIGTVKNTPVIATKNGTVTLAVEGCVEGNYECGGGFGNHVRIDHGDGMEAIYAHLSSTVVKIGDTVSQGQLIGYSGNTGRSTGPHLHFELRLNGTKVDPLDYVSSENPRPVQSSFKYSDSNDYKSSVCSTLLASGFSKNATAGIMVNLYAESGFSPINLQNTYETSLGFSDLTYTEAVDKGKYKNFIYDEAGYGLAQWTYYSRKQNLYNFAKSKKTSIGDLAMQLEFLLNEFEGYGITNKYITGTYSADSTAKSICLEFERPKNKETVCPSRAQQYSNEMLNYINNGCK